MFISKKTYLLWLDNKDKPALNRMMIETFPFLMPHNRWTDATPENFNYSYNEMNAMPYGWAKAFGYEMLCEIRDELVRIGCLDTYRIMDIKEKYGTLHWYDNGSNQELFSIIKKYISLSASACQVCGKPATHMTQGWIGYFCRKCGKKLGAIKIPKDWWEQPDDED